MMSSRLVVAQLIETMGMGGAEHLAVQLANHVGGSGAESHLIVMGHEGPMSARVSDAVLVHYLQFDRAPITDPLRFFASIRSGIRRLASILGEHEISLVQTHLPGANFWGMVLSRRGPWCTVATVHNNQEFRYGVDDPGWKVMLRRRAYREVVRSSAATIAVSEAVARSLIAELGGSANLEKKVVAIPNGVPVPPEVGAEERRAARCLWGIPEGDGLIVSVGRLDVQKNFGDLVASVAVLRESGEALRLIIAGEGPGRVQLEEFVAEHRLEDVVSLPGLVSDVPSLLGAADVFVSTSLWEGLPLVVLEAMAAGLPIVGNRINGLKDVVREGESGLLVTPKAPEETAGAIRALLRDPAMRVDMGRSARRRVEEQFGFEKMGSQVLSLYRRLVSNACASVIETS